MDKFTKAEAARLRAADAAGKATNEVNRLRLSQAPKIRDAQAARTALRIIESIAADAEVVGHRLINAMERAPNREKRVDAEEALNKWMREVKALTEATLIIRIVAP